MYESIHQLLNSPLYRPRLDRIIDLTHAFLIDPDKEAYYTERGEPIDEEVVGQFKVFDECAPYVEGDSFDILQYKIKRNMTIGSLTAKGGQVPSTSAGQLITAEGGMAKITLSHVYDEKIMEQMIKLRNSQFIPDDFVDLLFGSVTDLRNAVFKLGNVFTAMVWSTGKIRFSDPRTGVELSVDYDVYPQLFPRPLTGGATWDNYDTANGIENIIELISRPYYAINGVYPKKLKLSEVAINHLLRQESTANYARSLGLISANATSNLPSRVSRKILNQMSEDITELPALEQWDARYELEIEKNRSMSFPYNPEDTVTIVTPNVVERVWGLTVESALGSVRGYGLERNNSQKPMGGIFTFSDEIKSVSPPQTRDLAVGQMIPWLNDNRKIGALKVLN